jgi:hypothetical protein
MSHLTADELIDAAEGALDARRVPHLSDCDICRSEAERLQAVLGAAIAVDIPEPSPLFWDQLSSRVHHAVAAEVVTSRNGTPQWLRWPVIVPITAMALVVMALAAAVARGPATTAPASSDGAAVVTTGDPTDDPETLGQGEWAVVSEIIGPVDFDQAREAGIVVKPGDVEQAASELTADEQQVLIALVKEATTRPGV